MNNRLLSLPQLTALRVQRKRTKGWKMPPNTVYVGRPTVFGNYHAAARWDDDEWEFGPFDCWEEAAVFCYRAWLTADPAFMRWWRLTLYGCLEQMSGDESRHIVLARLPELRGKNLACWCRIGRPCHADVLLELANQ